MGKQRDAFSHYNIVSSPLGKVRWPKRIWLTEEEALEEVERMIAKFHWVFEAYECGECGHWHVGSVPNESAKVRTAE